jgi:hypothetical protein
VLGGHEDCVQNNEKGYGIFKVLVLHQPIEENLNSFRVVNFLSELLSLSNFLDFDPLSLVFCYKQISKFFFFLDGIEIVNDDSDE